MTLIAISGSQGTGKTTILTTLQSRGFNTIKRKTSRSVLADLNLTLMGVYSDHDKFTKFQDLLLERKIKDDIINPDYAITFTERCFADLFVYPLIILGYNNKYSSWLNEYYEKCKEANKRYDGIIYLTSAFKVEDDNVRSTNNHFSDLVDSTIYSYIYKMIPEQKILKISNSDHNIRMRIIELYITDKRIITNNPI